MAWYFLYRRLAILCLLVSGALIYFFILRNIQIKGLNTYPWPLSVKPMKKILYWNKFFNETDFNFGSGQAPFLSQRCPESMCTITSLRDNETQIQDFDAILFHGDNFPQHEMDFPKSRDPKQRYVLYLSEPPGNIVDHLQTVPRGFFNWTMTYRLDSDILVIYGYFRTLTESSEYLIPPTKTWEQIPNDFTSGDLSEHATEIIARKTKLVAWFVSRCKSQSKREIYVNELRKYIDVDIYGKCGNVSCLPIDNEECYQTMETTFKFYLSFENAICDDYVTDQLFHVMQYYVVPVVFGGANYSERVPPGSYIDAKDFGSPELLARYLLHLDSHPEEYAKFFWWKTRYVPTQYRQFCQLCEMLHREDEKAKSYSNIREWFRPPGICQNLQYIAELGITT